jgi:O-antigen ligase
MKKIVSTTNILFYILLALLPFNARYILNFQQINNLEGFREHLTWSVYLFDIVFVALLTIYGFSLLHNLLRNKLRNNKSVTKDALLYFILTILLSCFFALNKNIAFHSCTYLIGAILFFFIAKNLFKDKKVFFNSALIIFLSGILQSIIAIFQFVSQKSIGLYFMGESQLTPHALGVAKFEMAGEKFIRAYGTFSHPNLLGAFLIFALICGLWLLKNNICHSSLCHPRQSRVLGRNPGFKNKSLLVLGNFLILIGIFLTFSRSVWLTTFLIILSLLVFNRKKIAKIFSKLSSHQKISSIALLMAIIFLMIFAAFPRLHLKNCFNDRSYDLRKAYNQTAFKVIHENPILGVGPGNFTLVLAGVVETSQVLEIASLQPWELQPVHNLYLLIASEIGLVGLIIFIFFLLRLSSVIPYNKTGIRQNLFLYLFLAYLFLGFFDHYFWTLPQGQMLFWLCLAFFVSSSRIKKVEE